MREPAERPRIPERLRERHLGTDHAITVRFPDIEP